MTRPFLLVFSRSISKTSWPHMLTSIANRVSPLVSNLYFVPDHTQGQAFLLNVGMIQSLSKSCLDVRGGFSLMVCELTVFWVESTTAKAAIQMLERDKPAATCRLHACCCYFIGKLLTFLAPLNNSTWWGPPMHRSQHWYWILKNYSNMITS